MTIGSSFTLYPIETVLKSIYNFRKGKTIKTEADFLENVKNNIAQ